MKDSINNQCFEGAQRLMGIFSLLKERRLGSSFYLRVVTRYRLGKPCCLQAFQPGKLPSGQRDADPGNYVVFRCFRPGRATPSDQEIQTQQVVKRVDFSTEGCFANFCSRGCFWPEVLNFALDWITVVTRFFSFLSFFFNHRLLDETT